MIEHGIGCMGGGGVPCDCDEDEALNPPRPVSDPSETLALIAEYRLTVAPHNGGWWVTPPDDPKLLVDDRSEFGATIGDAVRACVERIEAGRAEPCDCTHPLSVHREGEEGGETDDVVLCDHPGCLCPGFLARAETKEGGRG